MRLLLLLLAAVTLSAQTAPSPIRTYREAHELSIFDEFVAFLTLPNVSSDLPNLQRNADLLQRMMQKRGIHTQLLSVPGVAPAVYGELPAPGATRTVVFYAHYDGQPSDAAQWKTKGPFIPSLRTAMLEADGREIPLPYQGRLDPEWRLYARSSSDDKAAIVAMLTAIDGLSAAGKKRTVNLKFLFEGEEEKGSPHLADIIAKHKELLKSDVWFICDGPVSQNRQQQVYFGARGDVTIDLTVYGPRRELHSGHYGNWAPNPALMLVHLLAGMRDEDGRVKVAGFYDGVAPLGPVEKKALAEAPDVDTPLKKELWLGRTEGNGRSLNDVINEPALNIRGLQSASIGAQARNVVPATALASIDIRLVKGQDHRKVVSAMAEHIRRQGYFVTDGEPDQATLRAHPKVARFAVSDSGYNAVRTAMDLPICQETLRRIEAARGPVVKMPTLGGSVPLFVFEEAFGVPLIGIPIANHDNSQHAANENIRLQNLWDGIETMASLM